MSIKLIFLPVTKTLILLGVLGLFLLVFSFYTSLARAQTPVPCNHSADANGDGNVTFADFLIWVGNYGKLLTSQNQGEFTCNGKVNSLDFGKLFKTFVKATPLPSAPSSPPPPPPAGAGIWLSPAEIANLEPTGAGWENVSGTANQAVSDTEITLNNQDSNGNIKTMAKALVCAKNGQHCVEVVSILKSLRAKPINDRTLALGRELAAYIISADLVNLKLRDPSFDQSQFRPWLRTIPNLSVDGDTLVECHEQRQNNWSTVCGASRMALYAYLGDTAGLARTWDVYRGYVGDRSVGAYTGFGVNSTSWRCPNPGDNSWVNPAGCTKDGHDFSGILPEEMRRGGEYSGQWPPPITTAYPWGGMQGLIVQAEILYRNGYPNSYQVGDQAIRRAYNWMFYVAGWPADPDDQWQAWIANKRYGTNFPAPAPARAGKIMGWSDWTHQ